MSESHVILHVIVDDKQLWHLAREKLVERGVFDHVEAMKLIGTPAEPDVEGCVRELLPEEIQVVEAVHASA